MKFATILSLLTVYIFSAKADSSKIQKIDLDISSTVLTRAELGQFGWYYWIDETACICWIGGKTGSDNFSTASIVDCKKLKGHVKLQEHLSCLSEDSGTKTEEPKKQ